MICRGCLQAHHLCRLFRNRRWLPLEISWWGFRYLGNLETSESSRMSSMGVRKETTVSDFTTKRMRAFSLEYH